MGNEWLSTYFTCDLLDNIVRVDQEINDTSFAATRYRYDRNENMVLIMKPAANLLPGNPARDPSNVGSYIYDERDLPAQSTKGGLSAQFKGLAAHDDIPETSTIPNSSELSSNSLNYNGNGNPVEAIDAEDNNGDGQSESTLIGYDGYDRAVNTTESAGGLTQFIYDPAGNLVRSAATANQVDQLRPPIPAAVICSWPRVSRFTMN